MLILYHGTCYELAHTHYRCKDIYFFSESQAFNKIYYLPSETELRVSEYPYQAYKRQDTYYPGGHLQCDGDLKLIHLVVRHASPLAGIPHYLEHVHCNYMCNHITMDLKKYSASYIKS